MASQSAQWASPVGNLDPAILTIRLHMNPRIVGEMLNKIHKLLDKHDRYTSLQLLTASLRQQTSRTWVRICEDPDGLQHALIDVVSGNFLCGLSKDDFSGPSADWSTSYANALLTLLDDFMRCFIRIIKDQPQNSALKQAGEQALMGLNPFWNRLMQPDPTAIWHGLAPDTDLADAPATIPTKCAALVGLGYVLLYLNVRRRTQANTMSGPLISHIIRAFCLSLKALDMDEFNVTINQLLVSVTSIQERRTILADTFDSEFIARMFMKTYCNYITGRLGSTFMERIEDPPPKIFPVALLIAQFLHTVVGDAPEVLLRVISSPGTLEKLISTTMRACQRARCHQTEDSKDHYAVCFMFTVRTITLPVLKRRQYAQHPFSLDVRISNVLLSYCTLGLAAELESTTDDAEALLNCITMYALPGAKSDISTLSQSRQHDVNNLKKITQIHLEAVGAALGRMQRNSNLRLRVAHTVRQISNEVIPSDIFALGYLGPRLHRCSCFACECSGMKPPHGLHVCKGCWSAFYCSRQCQKQDWEQGLHRIICRRRAERLRSE